MGKNISFYTLFVLIYVLISTVSSYLSGWISSLIYVFSFALPVLLSFLYSRGDKRAREEERGLAEPERRLFRISMHDILLLLPVAAPLIGVVFLVSFLTSSLLGALGLGGAPVYAGSFAEMLIENAIAPAILEELLFRYVPILLIAPYSKKYTVILSSVYFALIHMNVWQMPYALFAGAVFILADLSFSSVIPSLVLHLLNNVVSCVWTCFIDDGVKAAVFVSVLTVLSAASFAFIAVKRRVYVKLLRQAFVLQSSSSSNVDFDV